MLDLNNPYTQDEILVALRMVANHIGDYFAGLPTEQFRAQTDGTWSAQLHLQHLLLSNKPLAKALQLPPDRLEKLFGRSERSSEDYDTIVRVYRQKLNEGLRAEGTNFEPIVYRMPDEVTDVQTYLVEEWRATNEKLLAAIDMWSDTDLDAYLLPHPVAPDMTVREMLLFTLYHDLHHLNDVEQQLQI